MKCNFEIKNDFNEVNLLYLLMIIGFCGFFNLSLNLNDVVRIFSDIFFNFQ